MVFPTISIKKMAAGLCTVSFLFGLIIAWNTLHSDYATAGQMQQIINVLNYKEVFIITDRIDELYFQYSLEDNPLKKEAIQNRIQQLKIKRNQLELEIKN